MVLALNTVSGQVSDVAPKMLEHPHFSKYLVAVEDNAKPYIPEMYKGGTVEEKAAESPKINVLAKKKFEGKKKSKGAKAPEVNVTPKPDIDIEDEN